MRKDDLFKAIGECDDKFLLRSEKSMKKKSKSTIIKILPMVAVAAMLGILCINAKDFEFNKGDEKGRIESETSIDGSAGGNGEEDEVETIDKLTEKEGYGLETEYDDIVSEDLFFSGTVLPLTLEEENTNILAVRNIDFDFKKFDSFENEGNVVITDSYSLTNTSQKTQVINVKYPYIESLYEIDSNKPDVKVNGKDVSANIAIGRYDDESILLDNFDYSLLDEKVVVYEYIVPQDANSENGCFTVQISGVENERDQTMSTKILENNIYRVNMKNYNLVGNTEYHGFLTEDVKESGKNPMLIFYGTEPEAEDYKEQGYESIIYSESTEKNDLNVERIRYESTFEEVLKRLIDEEIEEIKKDNENLEVSKELYYKVAGYVLCQVIEDNNDGVNEFYLEQDTNTDSFGDRWEDSISEIVATVYDEACEYFISKEIEISAGETVTFEISYEKEGKHSKTVPDSKYLGRYGYDNMINLGTNLYFEQQNASVEDHGYIDIVNQNYGFDLENGVKDVVLDMGIDYYYMVVKRIE